MIMPEVGMRVNRQFAFYACGCIKYVNCHFCFKETMISDIF
jgi:hypothetical protein